MQANLYMVTTGSVITPPSHVRSAKKYLLSAVFFIKIAGENVLNVKKRLVIVQEGLKVGKHLLSGSK